MKITIFIAQYLSLEILLTEWYFPMVVMGRERIDTVKTIILEPFNHCLIPAVEPTDVDNCIMSAEVSKLLYFKYIKFLCFTLHYRRVVDEECFVKAYGKNYDYRTETDVKEVARKYQLYHKAQEE